MQNLKRELVRAKEEVKRIQSVPLVIGQFLEIIDHNHGIVSSSHGIARHARCAIALKHDTHPINAGALGQLQGEGLDPLRTPAAYNAKVDSSVKNSPYRSNCHGSN